MATATVTAPRAGQTTDYVDLDGAEGRAVSYRPDRYPRRALEPMEAWVEVLRDHERVTCRMHDISLGGVALEWTGSAALRVGEELERIVVTVDGHQVYRGSARVASLRRASTPTIVGLELLGSLVDVDQLFLVHEVTRQAAGALREGSTPWRVGGLHAYKAAVSDLRIFLEDARVQLDALEATLPPGILGGPGSPARDALIARLRADFVVPFVRAANDIDGAAREAGPGQEAALREIARRQVHELLMHAPWGRRALAKPLGYPGDYELMIGLYGNHFDGGSLYSRAINLGFTWMPAAEAVRTRKDLIKSELMAALDVAPADRPLRILSIAAGPAQEIFEVLSEREGLAGPVEIVLFEQDRRALAYAYDRLTRLVRQRWSRQVKLVLLNDSIKRLLLDPRLFAASGTFDFVYACGLADYLQRNAWLKLARTLHGVVAPGGALYIGNMVPSNPTRWLMDIHLDWPLIYRDRGQLLELGTLAAPGSAVRLCEEPTGVNPLVGFRRP